jgi:hypothetical protein
MAASEPGRKKRLPQPTLRGASALAAIGATAIPLSLFLSWFEILEGDKEGNYTGWYSFHRTDRVLAVLALASLGSAFLSPSRRVAAVRGVLGLAAVVVIAREEPLLTNFPMYSGTWSSEEAFNEGSSTFSHYRFERRPARGRRVDLTARIEAIGGSDPLVDAFEAQDGEELEGDEAKDLTAGLPTLESTYEQRYGESLGRVHTVSERTAGFDFDRGAIDERVLYRTTHVVDPSRFQATAVLYHASVPTVGFPR